VFRCPDASGVHIGQTRGQESAGIGSIRFGRGRRGQLISGTPMKEIADVLRHRSLDTSAIYTKVDLISLASVALPWPGSAS
jgi:integrase/recombinase XerD